MIFRGYSRIFSTENEAQYESIGAFWDEMSALFGRESLRGLGYNWTADSIEYVIGLKSNQDMEAGTAGEGSVWKEIMLPDDGWKSYRGRTEELGALYTEIYKDGELSFEIEEFSDDGSCTVSITRCVLKAGIAE